MTPPQPPPGTPTTSAPAATDPGGTTADAGNGAGPASAPRLPGYEVLGELGAGGMGVVYKARQVLADRVVAVKMIRLGAHAGAPERARFQAEVRAVARLAHPNIVPVFEVGEHESCPFFSMEFCPAGSLRQRLDGRPLPPREAAALVARLARAMHAAHSAGIVHRDLKPANILLTGDGTPKVADFGLAKIVDQSAGQTRSGAILGTPSYMAPEQARGQHGQVGPHTDVWALGAILYECLTGRPPFLAASDIDTVVQVVSAEPVPVRRAQPGCPRDLETVCLKCLSKEPGQRYPSAEALADDLERFLANRPVKARPVGRLRRVGLWCRRNPVLAGLLATQLVLLAGVAALLVDSAVRRDREAMKRGDMATSPAGAGMGADDWDRRAGEIVRMQQAHGGPVTALAFGPAPDGALVSGDAGGDVILWDAASGKRRLLLKGHASRVVALRVSPGRVHAVAEDGSEREWDTNPREGKPPAKVQLRQAAEVRTGRVVSGPAGKKERVRSWADGGPGSPVWAWGAEGGRVVGSDAPFWGGFTVEKAHAGPVTSLALGRGRWLASGGGDGAVKLWDLYRAVGSPVRVVHAWTGHEGAVTGVAFGPGAKRVASAGEDGTVRLWDVGGARKAGEFVFRGHRHPVHALAWDARLNVIASANAASASGPAPGTVLVWDPTAGAVLDTFRTLSCPVQALTFHPGRFELAFGCADGSVGVWRLGPGHRPLAVQAADLFGAAARGPLAVVPHLGPLPRRP